MSCLNITYMKYDVPMWLTRSMWRGLLMHANGSCPFKFDALPELEIRVIEIAIKG